MATSSEGDAFVRFINHAQPLLLLEDDSEPDEAGVCPSWSRIASRTRKTCLTYSSGVTSAILLSDLFQAWKEQRRSRTPKRSFPECGSYWTKKNRPLRIPNTVTIDSIYEKELSFCEQRFGGSRIGCDRASSLGFIHVSGSCRCEMDDGLRCLPRQRIF